MSKHHRDANGRHPNSTKFRLGRHPRRPKIAAPNKRSVQKRKRKKTLRGRPTDAEGSGPAARKNGDGEEDADLQNEVVAGNPKRPSICRRARGAAGKRPTRSACGSPHLI
ncbi:hypothetical protein MTO96_015449 [Rhipicephalus appendiculatus]